MHKKLVGALSLLCSLSAAAFDNDFTINRPNLDVENFLDINNVRFEESFNELWYQSANGWRMTGHSLTTDLLQIDTEVKLMDELSDAVNVHFNYKQEIFYADKPIEDSRLEFEFMPFDRPLSISFISTVNYRKANVDMGIALTYGQRTANYLRLQEIVVDPLFNQKNSDPAIDQASYTDFQHIWSIDGAYQWDERFAIRFDLKDLSELVYNFDDQVSQLTHGGYEYEASFKYKHSRDDSWILSLKGFKTDKSLTATGSAQVQQLEYNAVDLKWLTRQSRPYQFTAGIRDDNLTNDISDIINASNNLDYSFRTTQVYSTVQHAYREYRTWNVGLYIGLTQEPNDFNLVDTSANDNIYQGQLRTSWIFSSKDKKSNLQLHLTFNLDRLRDDPGDGVGLSYQSVF